MGKNERKKPDAIFYTLSSLQLVFDFSVGEVHL